MHVADNRWSLQSTGIGLCDGYLKCGDNCSRFCVVRLRILTSALLWMPVH